MNISKWAIDVSATDPLSILLYLILAVIALFFLALNLRTGPVYGSRHTSTVEVITGRYLGRIGILKAALAILWVVLLVIVIFRWLGLSQLSP